MIIHQLPQRTPEWSALRLGRVCSSRAADMLATIKSGEAAARRNLRVELVLERVTGRSMERQFTTAALQDGIDREPDAVATYEALTGTLIDTSVGFCAHDTLMAGCSPDGVVGDFDGIVEIKCPMPATHLEYLRTGKIPADYLKQITHSLFITDAPWCDWLSYQPMFPATLQVKLTRVHRTDVDIHLHETAVKVFLAEVDQEETALRTMADIGGTLKAAVA